MSKHAPGLKITEDARVFGDDWVYCNQHLRPHSTGWCSVGAGDKLGLGIPPGEYDERLKQAYRKCKKFGLPILWSGINNEGATNKFSHKR